MRTKHGITPATTLAAGENLCADLKWEFIHVTSKEDSKFAYERNKQ